MVFKSDTILGTSKVKYQYLIFFVIALSISALSLLNAGFDNQWVFFALIVVCLSFFICLLFSRVKKSDILPSAPAVIYIVFIIWVFISTFWSSFKMRTLVEGLYLVFYGFVFIAVSNMTKKHIKLLFDIIIISGTMVSAIGIFLYSIKVQDRVVSTMSNANAFGIYSVMIFILAWGFYLSSRRRIYLLPAFIISCSIMLSGSRASLLIMSITLFIMIMFGQGKRYRAKALVSTCFINAASYVTVIFMKSAVLSQIKIDVISRTGTFTTSVFDRLKFWAVALKIFKQSPVTGSGYGTFFTEYANNYDNIGLFSRYAHNHYLQLLSETGIIGFSLFIIFLLMVFIPVLKNIRKVRTQSSNAIVYVSAAFAFLIHIGMDFSFNFPAVAVLFFAVTGAAVSGINDIKGEHTHEKRFKIRTSLLSSVLAIIIVATSLYLFTLNYYNVCRLNEERENISSAQSGYELIVRLNPINPVFYDRLGNFYFERYIITSEPAYYDKSVEYIKKAVSSAPYEWKYHKHLGDIYKASFNAGDAISAYKNAVKYSLYFLEPYIELIHLLHQVGDNAQALEYCDYAIKLYETRKQVDVYNVYDKEYLNSAAQLYRITASLYSANNEFEKSDESLQKFIDIINQYPELQYLS